MEGEEPLTFFAVHPWGTEEFVENDVSSVLRAFPKCTLRLAPAPKVVVVSGEATSQSAEQLSSRGLTFLAIDSVKKITPENTSALLDGVYRLRSVDGVYLWLTSCVCALSSEELTQPVMDNADVIQNAVEVVLPELHRLYTSTSSLGATDPVFAVNPQFFQCGGKNGVGSSGRHVLFRVNSVRRNKCNKNVTSQGLAQHVGDVLYERYSSRGWKVNLLYYNVEFLVVHDGNTAHIGVSLHPPNVPRSGSDVRPLDAVAREVLRQRIGVSLMNAQKDTDTDEGTDAISAADVVARQLRNVISRPSHFKHELRHTKGDNAMHPAIASLLGMLSDPQDGEVVVDPLCGCGTVLMEAGLRNPSLLLLGGDLKRDDAHRSVKNLMALGTEAYLQISPQVTCAFWRGSPLSQRVEGSRTSAASFLAAVAELADTRNVSQSSTVTTSFSWNSGAWRQFQTLCNEYFCGDEDDENNNKTPTYGKLPGIRGELCLSPPPCFSVFQWDAIRLPFRDGAVDVIASDLPFGRRCGNHAINAQLYPKLLQEFHRVLRKGPLREEPKMHEEEEEGLVVQWWRRRCGSSSSGRCVLLTIEGKTMKLAIDTVKEVAPFRMLREPWMVDMGGLCPYVFVLDALSVAVAPPTGVHE